MVFNENMYNHLQNQMKRSTLISAVSEKRKGEILPYHPGRKPDSALA